MTASVPVDLQSFLKALASETRQDALMLFADGQPRTVNQVAETLGLGQSTTSEQLALMRRSGLLKSTKNGKEVLYQPDRDAILSALRSLEQWLTQCC